MELGGLHHLTAVTGDAPANVTFYTEVLGLHLVKKTVNQDDVSAYHLFYGDDVGHAGTEVTFFDWPRLAPRVHGVGTISTTALRVPSRAAVEWWARRLEENGVAHGGVVDRGGRAAVAFEDPEGQRLELVDDGGAPGGTPWAGSPVPPEMFVRGLHAVKLTVEELMPTAWLLTEVLGFRRAGEYEQPDNPGAPLVAFAMGPGGPGAELWIEERPQLPPGVVGTGGVHHVAFRTPDVESQARWRERIAGARVPVTQIVDRFYFQSIYFREPGGVLFEIATDGPGFATDEDPAHLGERLALPPFLEPRRAQIEAGLTPLPTARAGR